MVVVLLFTGNTEPRECSVLLKQKGVGDYAKKDGGLKNTSIALYENGNKQYYGCAISSFSHNFFR